MQFHCYSYWKYHHLNQQPEIDDEQEVWVDTECQECQGWGYKECDLGHEHDCQECNGSGQVQVTEKDDNVLQVVYKQQVLADIKKFCDYTNNDPMSRSALYNQLSMEFANQCASLLNTNYFND